MTILRYPAHPWLFGAVPIVFLYSQNFGLVIEDEVPALVIWMLVVTTIGYVAAYGIARNSHKAALIVSSVSVIFSLSGHAHNLVAESEPLIVWTPLALIATAIMVSELQLIRSARFFEQLTVPLNLGSFSMVLVQLAALFSQFPDLTANPVSESMHNSMSTPVEFSPRLSDSIILPDIYFIIPDAYPSDAWMLSAMDYDNSAFSEALKARGFVIASHAQSNYGSTLPSLASILNMRHFNVNPTDLDDVDYLRYAISTNEVARFLRLQGYTYIQLLSGHLFPSPLADINRDFTPGGPVDVSIEESELDAALWDTAIPAKTATNPRRFYQQSFLTLYIETTLLKVLANQGQLQLHGNQSGFYAATSPHRFLDTVEGIDSIVAMPEATFAIIHLMKPHRPVTFDAYGNIIETIKTPNRNEHLAELQFINTKFIEMIDTILAGSRHQPVIIFQADHGSTNGKVRGAGYRLIHFNVYSAFYLPDGHLLKLPQPYTTVNTFPLILNTLFDAGFELRDNRIFELTSKSSRIPLELKEVTESFANWLN